MDKALFLSQLERGEATSAETPVSQALLRALKSELSKGEPAWWAAAQKAWEKRRFVGWMEAWALFLSCLHFEALDDEQSPFVPYFPSCGGTDEADPSAALSMFLARPPASFYENLKKARRRPFLWARSTLWIPPAILCFQRRGLPFYVAQAGAGAGLDLSADKTLGFAGFDSELVLGRVGIDSAPLSLGDIRDRRWLTACLFPDQMRQIRVLDQVARKVKELDEREAGWIQLVKCRENLSGPFLAKNLPAEDDAGILLFNMGTSELMSDEEYRDYQAQVARMMAPWEDRALWVEVEHVRGELYSTTLQLRVWRIINGALDGLVMAAFDHGEGKIVFDEEAAAKFLS